ncbi:MAG TPA: UPF0182 family protein, partial [Ardenticatenaceae bacterium]|nr:UPF0182 family protein [Ardenticatenaceae bacterium]
DIDLDAWRERARRNREGPPRPPRPPAGAWLNRWTAAAALLLLLFGLLNWGVTALTEWLWFGELGYQRVWVTAWSTQVGLFLLFFAVALVVLLANWRLARAAATRGLAFTPEQEMLEQRWFGWLLAGGALFFAWIFAGAGARAWMTILRYLHRTSFGVADPIFNRDVGFYVFELPVYQLAQGWTLNLLLFALLGAAGIYALAQWQSLREGDYAVLPHVRRHLAILFGLLFLLMAAGQWLDAFELNYSERGVAFGASYTDLRTTLLSLRIQMVLMVVTALLALANVWQRRVLLPAAALGLWMVTGVLIGGLYASVLQRYSVEPNELALEAPFIRNNIEFTRRAYGLDRIEERAFDQVTELAAADLEANPEALRNVRLWDYRPLLQTYGQLQELRTYYDFHDVDIDRYVVDGELRQVMLSARELNKDLLPSRNWVNTHLEFTHGFGVVMNPVDEVTREGRPNLWIKDLPPQSTQPELEVTRPEIYFGELTDDHVFAPSGLHEFDYPQGDENVYSQYAGTGGVPLDSALVRMAFALRLGEPNLLLSGYIDESARVLMHREIRDRVARLAPFLVYDRDPYLVLDPDTGRLVWIQDAYTVSDHYPYATPINLTAGESRASYNYIRNAAKVVVDAYDGSVGFYIADPDDPLIQTYSRVFPGLLQPLDALSAGLQAHLRYPEDLFRIQAQLYGTYHMRNEQVFYNKEDQWAIPVELVGGEEQQVEPYYVVLSLPDEDEAEFLLIQPYTPANRQNMIAWLAARNDPPHIGELVVYEFPKQELVFGPQQVEGRIDQDPEISQQLTLWGQVGSNVIRGNLLVIPIDNSVLYVEPLYLQAQSGQLPELRRIIVASGERVAMRPTLAEALAALVGEEPGTVATQPDEEGTEGTAAPTDMTVEGLILSANEHYIAAEEARVAGDWARYGQELELLERDLQALMELTGQAAAQPAVGAEATPTP